VDGGGQPDPGGAGPLQPTPGLVPEPADWALMIQGVFLAGATLRRRRSMARARA
jgi:hypothetical protein